LQFQRLPQQIDKPEKYLIRTEHRVAIITYVTILCLSVFTVFYLLMIIQSVYQPGGLLASGQILSLSGIAIALLLPVIAGALLLLGYLLRKFQGIGLDAIVILFVSSLIIFAFTSENGIEFLAWTWLMLIGCAVSYQLFAFLKLTELRLIDRIAWGITFGLGFYSILGLALGILGLVLRPILIALLILLTLILYRQSRQVIVDVWSAYLALRRVVCKSPTPLAIVLTGLIAFCVLICYCQALTPEIHFDAIYYQLPVPKMYIEAGRLVELPQSYRSYFPKGVNFQFMVGLLLAGEATAKLFSFTAYIAVIVQVAALTQSVVRKSLAVLISAAIIATIPIAGWNSGTAYVDIGVTVFTLATAYGVFKWQSNKRLGWAIVVGLSAGLAIFAKIQALFFLPGLAILILLELRRFGLNRKFVGHCMAFVLPALLIGLPWYIITFIWTGSPVFPVFNAIFKSSLWPVENSNFGFGAFGVGTDLISILTLPWEITYNSNRFNESPYGTGLLGLTVLAALLWPVVSPHKTYRLQWQMTFLIAGFTLFWLIAQSVRYYLPVLPIYAILAASTFHYVQRRTMSILPHLVGPRWLSIYNNILLVTTLLGSIVMMWNMWWNIPGRIPLNYILGRQSHAEFIYAGLPNYQAYQFLKNYPAFSPVVLAVGIPDLLHFEPTSQIYAMHDSHSLVLWLNQHGNTPEKLAKALDSLGFTHLVYLNVHSAEQPPNLFTDAFIRSYLRPEFTSPNHVVFRILPDRYNSETPPPVTIPVKNPGFELLTNNQPLDWKSVGSPSYACGIGAFEGRCYAHVDTENIYFQSLPVEPGRLYMYSYFARSAQPKAQLHLHIVWRDKSGNILGWAVSTGSTGNTWRRFPIYATAPENAKTAEIYLRTLYGSEIDVDAVELQQFDVPLKPGQNKWITQPIPVEVWHQILRCASFC
jgi:4-amino-4-deoxy-L-arabinose transferase-like glycosyltransferase